jgi:hypothetical protein
MLNVNSHTMSSVRYYRVLLEGGKGLKHRNAGNASARACSTQNPAWESVVKHSCGVGLSVCIDKDAVVAAAAQISHNACTISSTFIE